MTKTIAMILCLLLMSGCSQIDTYSESARVSQPEQSPGHADRHPIPETEVSEQSQEEETVQPTWVDLIDRKLDYTADIDLDGDGILERIQQKPEEGTCALLISRNGEPVAILDAVDQPDVLTTGNGVVLVRIMTDDEGLYYINVHKTQYIGGRTIGEMQDNEEYEVQYHVNGDSVYDYYYRLENDQLLLVDEISYIETKYMTPDVEPEYYQYSNFRENGVEIDREFTSEEPMDPSPYTLVEGTEFAVINPYNSTQQ